MIRAPHLVQGDWLNSERAWTMEELVRDGVVLVDFWEYSCVNCLRTLPYLTEWHERYAPLGLRIVGIHTPEFAFGHEPANVERAIRRYDLPYPVLLDTQMQNWYAFTTRAWPTKILIDAHRRIRYTAVGEGRYAETEAMIQTLLRELHGEGLELPPPLDPVRPADVPGALCYPVTPELYAGYAHGRLGNPGDFGIDVPQAFYPVAQREEGRLYFEGTWHGDREFSESRTENAIVRVPYRGAELNAVMASADGDPVRVHLLHDGGALAMDEAGEDVVLDSEFGTYVTVSAPRMYALAQNPDTARHELSLEPNRPGLRIYAFSFVPACETPSP